MCVDFEKQDKVESGDTNLFLWLIHSLLLYFKILILPQTYKEITTYKFFFFLKILE